jgi:aspartate/methionine/tyrosine aminotransferase
MTSNNALSEPKRIRNLKLPERVSTAEQSARDADIDLLSHAPKDFLDTTHFDTVRFPPPLWAEEYFSRAASDGSLAYTGYRGHPQILESVAQAASGFLGCAIDPEHNILLTPGTQAGLFASLSSCVESGTRVAVVDPDYLFTARILRFLDSDIAYIPLVSTDEGPSPDLELMESEFANHGVKHLVFSHPNNPTGAVYPPKVINAIAKLAVRYDVRVIVDELYSRLIYDNTPFSHLAAEPGMSERVITLLGPSKTESLSGYRLGIVIGPKDLIARAENVLSITSLRAPAYAQHVLSGWLRDDKEWLESRILEFRALRELTLDRFRQLPWLKVQQHDATAYAWLDVSALNMPDATIATALLEKAGALISPGYQFGPSGKGHFRVCFARDEEQWSHTMEKMVQVLDDLAKNAGLPGKTI